MTEYELRLRIEHLEQFVKLILQTVPELKEAANEFQRDVESMNLAESLTEE
jgi:hypothetical protein